MGSSDQPLSEPPAGDGQPPFVHAPAEDAPAPVPAGESVDAALAPGADQPELIEEPGGGPRRIARWLKRSPPWLTSAVGHLALLGVLGLWTLPGLMPNLVPTLTASAGATDDPLQSLESELLPFAASSGESGPVVGGSLDALREMAATSLSSVTAAVDDGAMLDPVVADRSAAAELARLPADRLGREGPPVIRRRSEESDGADALLVGASDLNGAVDHLVGQIEEQLAEGDLLVVWLLDASTSLVNDRQLVADRLDPFLRRIAAEQKKNEYKLRSATVAFGKGVKEIDRASMQLTRTANAFDRVPIDPSGIENVFSAVEWCVTKYQKNNRSRLMIIVWTDESGDDIGRLEDTIDMCRRYGVMVSIVGPMAVLGREPGIHAYRLPENGMTYLLPVKKGPETAIPERIRLPYWFMPRMPDDGESVENARFRMPPLWQGGVQLEGLLSGFGPYALTRLARETGGTFTILDRPMDQAPFRLEVMRKYTPEYGPALSYRQMCEDKPLRRAVLQAVQATYADAPVGPPVTWFFGYYQEPAAFRNRLKAALVTQRQLATKALKQIDLALAAFGPEGMEEEFMAEYNLRWRAWHDVTRGRLLAAHVRYVEYLALCDLVTRPGALNGGTNDAQFVPAPIIRTGETTEALAREADRLLRRCITEHQGTPWSVLAERELDNAVGLDVIQRSLPRPPPVAAPAGGIRGGGGSGPKLPSL